MYKIIKVFCCRSCLDGCLGRLIGQGFREVRKDLIVRDDQMMACFVQDRLLMHKLRGYNFDEIQDCGNLKPEYEDELIEMARRGRKTHRRHSKQSRPDDFWNERISDAVDSARYALANPIKCPLCLSTNVSYATPETDDTYYCKNCKNVFGREQPDQEYPESTQEDRFGSSFRQSIKPPKPKKPKKPNVKTVETNVDRSIDLE